jgi:hypothetical protein
MKAKRMFVAVTVVAMSFLPAADALALCATNHNEVLLADD